jgi:hypothetical protein
MPLPVTRPARWTAAGEAREDPPAEHHRRHRHALLEKFNQQPVKELRSQAKAAGIKGWHSLRKGDLVARLTAHANAS